MDFIKEMNSIYADVERKTIQDIKDILHKKRTNHDAKDHRNIEMYTGGLEPEVVYVKRDSES